MALGDDIVDRNVHADVGQDAARAKRRALLPGVGSAAQLDVYLAGDQLRLGQFQRERQSGLVLLVHHSFSFSLASGILIWHRNDTLPAVRGIFSTPAAL